MPTEHADMARPPDQPWRAQARAALEGRRVLVTGGLGFIGSNLAIALVELGAEVLVIDAMLDEMGGNLFNLEPVRQRLQVNFCDIRDINSMSYLARRQDYVFHCASQVCHIKSLEDPLPDIDINIKGTAVLLEALRRHSPGCKVVKMGSRGQYGSVATLPAREDTMPDPKGIYEISLLAAEYILRSYHRIHGIRAVMLRLTNIYGPRAQMRHDRFGVANWFMRLALEDRPLPVYGDGQIKRDFLFIDDCVEAIIRAAVEPACEGVVLNVGRDQPNTFLELARTIVDVLQRGQVVHTPFSPERLAQEPGDFYSDISKIEGLTGWRPVTDLEQGVRRTLDYYLRHGDKYWP